MFLLILYVFYCHYGLILVASSSEVWVLLTFESKKTTRAKLVVRHTILVKSTNSWIPVAGGPVGVLKEKVPLSLRANPFLSKPLSFLDTLLPCLIIIDFFSSY